MTKEEWGFWKFWRESIRFWKFFDVTSLFKAIGAYKRYKKLVKLKK